MFIPKERSMKQTEIDSIIQYIAESVEEIRNIFGLVDVSTISQESFNEIEYFVKKPILETYCRNLENSVFERKVTNTKIKKIPVISNTNVLKSKNSIPKKEIINNPTAL